MSITLTAGTSSDPEACLQRPQIAVFEPADPPTRSAAGGSSGSRSHGTDGGTVKSTMRLREEIKPVTALKTGAARLLRAVGETRRPVVITQRGEPKGVLVDFESYEELREAVLLLKLIAQGEADVRARRTVSQDEVFRMARARLSSR